MLPPVAVPVDKVWNPDQRRDAVATLLLQSGRAVPALCEVLGTQLFTSICVNLRNLRITFPLSSVGNSVDEIGDTSG